MTANDTPICSTGALLDYLADCDDRGIEMPPWAYAQVHSRISIHEELLTLLGRAENFIAGFEDDPMQKGIPELLKQIRDAREKAGPVAPTPQTAGATQGESDLNDVRRPAERHYVRAAQSLYHEAGIVEIDDCGAVNFTDDGGAWVCAWVWVDDSDARDAVHKRPAR